jgi:hypothetical protein
MIGLQQGNSHSLNDILGIKLQGINVPANINFSTWWIVLLLPLLDNWTVRHQKIKKNPYSESIPSNIFTKRAVSAVQ